MKQPNDGDGATMVAGTDRYPVTIIKTTCKTITVQDDTATRIDENGDSEHQVYSIERNPNGKTYRFWKVRMVRTGERMRNPSCSGLENESVTTIFRFDA